jgi:hypothetical protein
MASQREYESVVWYFLQKKLEEVTTSELYDHFYSSNNQPHTPHGHARFEKGVEKVLGQVTKFVGEERP